MNVPVPLPVKSNTGTDILENSRTVGLDDPSVQTLCCGALLGYAMFQSSISRTKELHAEFEACHRQ